VTEFEVGISRLIIAGIGSNFNNDVGIIRARGPNRRGVHVLLGDARRVNGLTCSVLAGTNGPLETSLFFGPISRTPNVFLFVRTPKHVRHGRRWLFSTGRTDLQISRTFTAS